jgi:hypothetical protein
MATAKVIPAKDKLPQLRAELGNMLGKYIYQYTLNVDGTIILNAVMPGILTDVIRSLERDKLIVS